MPEARPPLFPLEGRSLTPRELGEAVLVCINRRIAAFERGERLPFKPYEWRAELQEEIAYVEGRRMVERVVAGEPWHWIRASAVEGRSSK